MPDLFVSVNFYGHGDPSWSGRSDTDAPRGAKEVVTITKMNFRRTYTLNAVGRDLTAYPSRQPGTQLWVQNFNAVLGMGNQDKCDDIAAEVMRTARKTSKRPFIMVTGYSAGATSAIYFGQSINQMNDAELIYVGLSDPAFYRGESAHLMTNPGVTARYRKNYYETRGNFDDVDEIHDAVAGFENINLDGQVGAHADASDDEKINLWHEDGVKLGNRYMMDDVRWCMKNCQ